MTRFRPSPAMIVVFCSVVLGLIAAPLIASQLPSTGDHGPWYASRAAGIAAYLMAWVAMLSGILGSTGAMDGWLNRARLMAIHQSASLTSVGLATFHALILIPDSWTDFSIVDIAVPFASSFRRVETAAGGASLYLFALISFSFWFRRVIGMRTWRLIHLGSLIAFAGALWHGLALGTDTREPWALTMYILTSSTVAGALVLRTVIAGPQPKPSRRPKAALPG